MGITDWIYSLGLTDNTGYKLYTLKYSLLICFLFNCLSSFSQTCIIAKKTKDAVYLGADSRFLRTFTYTDGTFKVDTGSMCKIFKEGNFNFALSGNALDESQNHVRQSCKNGGTFGEVIQRYSDSFRDWIIGNIDKLIKGMPADSFLSLYKKWQPYYANAIFFGKDNDSLFLAMPYFTVTLQPSGKLNVDSWVGKSDVLPAGHFDKIANVLWKKETWRGNIPEKIKSLIKIEIKAANQYEVGGQIHIIKFTKKDGLKWVGGKKPPCN